MAGKPGRSGRKPRPIALKIATGQNLPPGAVEAPAGRIEPPAWLDQFEREDFHRLTANVAKIDKLLSPVDIELYTKHAVIYGRWRRAREAITADLTREGAHGGEVCRAEVGVMERAERLLITIEQELGLTPSSRSRLKASEGGGEDAFDRLMREHGA
jgi:P27 family predicted phage terminase small subunit